VYSNNLILLCLKVLKALAREFRFYTSHLPALLQCFSPGSAQLRACTAVFGFVVDWENLANATGLMFGPNQHARLRSAVGPLWEYNREVPAGRYRLDLSQECDRLLLEKLKGTTLDWRAKAAEHAAGEKAAGRKFRHAPDLSQRGDGEPFRNSTLNGVPYAILSGEEASTHEPQKVPPKGVFVFDYLELPVEYSQGAGTLAGSDLPLMSEELFLLCHRKMKSWGGSYQGEKIDVYWLKGIIAGKSLIMAQLAAFMLEAFPSPCEGRIEIAMLLWSRTKDRHNGYMVLRSAGTPELRALMLERIGWLRLLNPFYPERGNAPSREWILDLEIPEQRVAAGILLTLATAGSDGRAVRAFYKKSDAKKDKERRMGHDQLAEFAGSSSGGGGGGGGGGGECLLPDRGVLRFGFDLSGEECGEDLQLRKFLAEERLGWRLPPFKAPPGSDTMEDWLGPFQAVKQKEEEEAERELKRMQVRIFLSRSEARFDSTDPCLWCVWCVWCVCGAGLLCASVYSRRGTPAVPGGGGAPSTRGGQLLRSRLAGRRHQGRG